MIEHISAATDARVVIAEFIKPMRNVLGQIRAADEDQAIATYVNALQRFSPQVLKLAAQRLAEVAGGRAWPLPAACVAVCEFFDRQVNPREAVKPAGTVHPEFAEQALAHPLALIALSEAWLLNYWRFAFQKGAIPSLAEIEQLKAQAAADRVAREGMAKSGNPVMEKFAADVVSRIAELEAKVRAAMVPPACETTAGAPDEPLPSH